MKTQTEFRDSQKAFNEAIASGHLSTDISSEKFAGHWMYMYSMNACDYFKNIMDRNYIEVPQSKREVA